MSEETVNITTEQQVVGVPFTSDDPRINRDGRPLESPEKKAIRKATKQFIAEYKEKLGEALPSISPVLIKKAIDGDMVAIKEVNDRVMGKAEQHNELDANLKIINVIVPKEVAKAFDIHGTNPEAIGGNSQQEQI